MSRFLATVRPRDVLAHLESIQACRRDLVETDTLHDSARRSLAAVVNHRLYSIEPSLDPDLDCPISQVARPAADPPCLGDPTHRIAKPHALDPAGDDRVPGDPLLRALRRHHCEQ
jgi:hypothetical protein